MTVLLQVSTSGGGVDLIAVPPSKAAIGAVEWTIV
jgi:hypothetical protein